MGALSVQTSILDFAQICVCTWFGIGRLVITKQSRIGRLVHPHMFDVRCLHRIVCGLAEPVWSLKRLRTYVPLAQHCLLMYCWVCTYVRTFVDLIPNRPKPIQGDCGRDRTCTYVRTFVGGGLGTDSSQRRAMRIGRRTQFNLNG